MCQPSTRQPSSSARRRSPAPGETPASRSSSKSTSSTVEGEAPAATARPTASCLASSRACWRDPSLTL
ncbi:hypothetical protein VO01_12610 [Clavibacter michiganensis subsp. insidiosus]|uniref:Uncharacterized protein n=1 Tax=Clavibacter michiganensis subsp. insidiosus TaxID=33014 RepID=A0A0D5CJQ2_9MICO|nr:hypothetical protein VO01_12610 [Clavibacter michiganensis subsp. insidiosus]